MTFKKTFIALLLLFFIIQLNCYSQISSCYECNRRLISSKDIKGKSLEELNLLRNEIYARKGYSFDREQYSRYFEQQDWYKPLSSNDLVVLSEIEKKNIEFLKQEGAEIGRRRNLALQDLNLLKKSLNNNDKQIAKKLLLAASISERFDGILDDLKFTLNQLDLENIHWNKHYGLYKIKIDNGYSISVYSIKVYLDKIEISGSDVVAHSENFGNFDDGYSDYMSEGESMTTYIFDITNTGIKYNDILIAG